MCRFLVPGNSQACQRDRAAGGQKTQTRTKTVGDQPYRARALRAVHHNEPNFWTAQSHASRWQCHARSP